ncbi:hypothetical protein L228DRAFT_62829 [Xylona heveae TC161]|uniref:Uncharacterized protein n=1 Tax=Xylona heveae (strain CBS 132557 / TC161) TaxID=1328760 RepID=A0A165INE8_XYLHT|nr:hypothetical protein L228DRAFT_62829 [Xylona heveae TC161]KZF25151.1 hypothetical protein L228DRAFT_62829 [Xylona heveae TC161]
MDPEFLDTLFRNFGPGGLDLPPPADFPSPREVRKEAQDRSKKILSSWRTLGKILDRHEELLRRRWVKKTTEQRIRILLTASPQLPRPHRPDFIAFRGETTADRVVGTEFRNEYLRPYMNLDDLSKARPLLLFLNSRGRHPPNVFAHSDLASAHLGLATGATMPPFLNGYTMLLNGQTVETYGKLISWNDGSDGFEMMMSGRGFHPGEGLVVLEIQQEIFRFLVRICQILLQDMDPNSLTDKEIPVQPEPPSLVGDPTEWPTLTSIRGEAPYRVPYELDLGRLEALIYSQRSRIEDHIWALRTDPAYFAFRVKEWGDHRQEVLKDTKGQIHPRLNLPIFWDRVLGAVITGAYGMLFVWDQLCRQVTEVTRLKAKYGNSFSPESPLPREYMKALLVLRGLLFEASELQTEYLKISVPASPPLRGLFVRVPPIPGSTKIGVRAKRDWTGDWLITLLYILWDPKQTRLLGLPNIIDFLDHISDDRNKPRISERINDILSDLGVIAEALHQINLHQPWASGLDHEQSKFGEEVEEEVEKKVEYFNVFSRHFGDAPLSPMSQSGPFVGGSFDYPVNEPQTQKTTEQMRKAEKNLDDFWRSAETHYQKETNGSSLQQALDTLYVKLRNPEPTAASSEPEQASIQESYIPVDPARPNTNKTYSSGALKATRDVRESEDAAIFAGSSLEKMSLEDNESSRSGTDFIQPTIPVGKRAFKTFSVLFPSSSSAGPTAELPWTDLLHAMTAMGFEPIKLYGSIWLFTPRNGDVERSIQFSEPHPKGKISSSMARQIGRRLQHSYEWHKDMFMLAQQEGKA